MYLSCTCRLVCLEYYGHIAQSLVSWYKGTRDKSQIRHNQYSSIIFQLRKTKHGYRIWGKWLSTVPNIARESRVVITRIAFIWYKYIKGIMRILTWIPTYTYTNIKFILHLNILSCPFLNVHATARACHQRDSCHATVSRNSIYKHIYCQVTAVVLMTRSSCSVYIRKRAR